MFRDNLSLLITVLLILTAFTLLSIISSIGLPLLAMWTLVLCLYYPYAKICKRFFKNTKLYSGCWRRLYRYCHFRKRILKYVF